MKNRFIGKNVRLIFEVIELLQERNEPGLLFFADFEKVFDSLSHNFIISALRKFNFGNDLIQYVKLFYTNITSIIINNDHFFRNFQYSERCETRVSIIIILVYYMS
jgi:hypothetical protein